MIRQDSTRRLFRYEALAIQGSPGQWEVCAVRREDWFRGATGRNHLHRFKTRATDISGLITASTSSLSTALELIAETGVVEHFQNWADTLVTGN